jgi:hemolysin III
MPRTGPERLADGGPVYYETNFDRLVAEPWNAASAAVFLGLVAMWAIRLRGQHGRFAFLSGCLPVLALGGVGGTLYHAFRNSNLFFLMDVWPIIVLCFAACVYLWVHCLPRWQHVFLIVPPFMVMQPLLFRLLPNPDAINVSYAMLGGMIAAPTAIVLWQNRFRHAVWVAAGLGCFAAALFFRAADSWRPPLLPMGTHWLWHLGGALACGAVTEFLYRLRRDELLRRANSAASVANGG